ncbi:hypothetical protein ZYGR_0E01270 [Zygosaccharomyces rouxii]|uniref:proline--tRNA ligase n=2 Tax=Zygosaccharomyces rouxii TaxID=4956 RepID=C5DQT3_ZYGRC|nr:uncharacterized protein ZYRO0B02794g [Zygosaccharomyces rouxii]KAH9200306.1 hypothetical protein LQ764DRAFT_114474 [Zygosaccharomyces rouxii]GAV47112.1 hypothetical protein ZYGR_0E01270 [Zygosaccharomyces rouxii]CAR26144.1 ZYRO0B02794p [Zygosaccharomyces rouxii]
MLRPKVLLRYSHHVFQPKTALDDSIKALPTHELFQTLGFIRQSQSGLVHWLPMGLRTLNKVESIVRHRMNQDGDALEVSLSALSPRSLWEKTNRWSGTELFKLKDAKKASYCLTPTCEEDITNLMNEYITSYRDMPTTVYQITRKYRDELRPRGGLLRGREFLMKDAYSFASNEEEALQTFQKMNAVYNKIFQDLKIPFVSAWADTGDIGGDLSKEYHYLHEGGEDTLLTCDQCGDVSNVEKCESFPDEVGLHSGDVNVKYALSKDHSTLICYYYPSTRQFSWNLAMDAMEGDVDVNLKNESNEKVLKVFERPDDEIMFSKILRVMDCRLNSRSNFPDFPLQKYLKNNFGQLNEVSLVAAEAGEICGSCEEGHLRGDKSIEVGHTFHLGTKYSEAMGSKFTDSNNNSNSIPQMGCYGIGISRLVGAIAEVARDSKGFKWPTSVSPYLMSICGKNEQLVQETRQTIESPDVLSQFNSKLGLGARIKLSHALGIPLAIIVGPKSWPKVEVEVRGQRWNGNETWKQSYETHKDEYDWQIIVTDDGTEKHLVPIENLSKICNILLEDL